MLVDEAEGFNGLEVELQCQRYRRAKWLFVDVQVGDYRDCDAKSDYRLLVGELDGTVTFTSSQSGTPLDDVRYNYHRRRDEWPFKSRRRKTNTAPPPCTHQIPNHHGAHKRICCGAGLSSTRCQSLQVSVDGTPAVLTL